MDVAAHRNCKKCSRRMSSYKYDKHSLCISCRDVSYSVDGCCSECSSWSTEVMAEYLHHHKSLVFKRKKKPVSTPSSSSPSLPPSAAPVRPVQSPTTALSSLADDSKRQSQNVQSFDPSGSTYSQTAEQTI